MIGMDQGGLGSMWKVAFHIYAFGGRYWLPAWTLEEVIRLTAEMGFEGLEPPGPPGSERFCRTTAARSLRKEG
jgi:hypothetical protein